MPILMYHQVSHFSPWKVHGGVFCETRRFRSQMAYLKSAGYSVVPLLKTVNCKLKTSPISLTFDDGYQNFADNAWPILQEFGYPATVYVLSSCIGGRAEWLKPKYEKAPLMDAATLRRLSAEGVNIGSHGRTHRRLATLPLDEQRREIADSKRELEDLLGKPVNDFCYPYGSYTPDTVRLVEESGYATAVTCDRRNPCATVHTLPRLPVNYGTLLPWFAVRLKMMYSVLT